MPRRLAVATAGEERLRVLYVANSSFYSRARTRLTALEALGADVTFIASGGEWLSAGGRRKRSILGLAGRLGLHIDSSGASAKLRQPLAFSPHLVWIDRFPNLSARTLALLRSRNPGAVFLMFSEDDMAMAHNQSPPWLAALPLYDVVVTTKIRNIEFDELTALGAKSVLYTRQAFDPEQQHPLQLSDEDLRDFGSDVSFVGTYEHERARSILSICNAGIPVRVWGSGWAGRIRHERLTIEGREIVNQPQELAYTKVVNAAKVNLGFLRKINRDQHTSRSIEIPACRAFMLAERTEEHLSMFKEGEEAEFFSDDAELVDKIFTYLKDEPRRLRVAAAGYKRASENYTNFEQVRRILGEIGFPAIPVPC